MERRAAWGQAWGRMVAWWNAESARYFLWKVALFAAGIALYFQWPTEPDWRFLAGVAALCWGGGWWRWKTRNQGARAALSILALLGWMGCGMAWASYDGAYRDAVQLRQPISPRFLVGTLEEITQTSQGVRLTLVDVSLEDPALAAWPKSPMRVRLTVRIKRGTSPDLPHIGERLRMRAGLLPAMGPAMPYGFDFSRYFYFRGIGAVGYGLPPWEILSESHPKGWREDFWNWRFGVTERILAQLGKREGAIAAGLITGDDRAMEEADYEALRASNLYHIIAISGEHMVIMAGVVFALLRVLLLMLLRPPHRYHPRVKTIAAACTLAVMTVYLGVTGAPLSAIRAYGMILLVLCAVMLRRQVDPMRSLAMVAGAMLLWDPSHLLEPGFQLSFAATLGIIAMVETLFRQRHALREAGDLPPPEGYPRKLLKATLLVALVAEAATAPFVIAQFNSFSLYGPLANMLATSLVSFFLMPTVVLFFLLLPVGGEGVALWLMQKGIQALLWGAHEVASWPHALLFLPSPPSWGVAMGVVGLLWVCLWQGRPRWWGVLPMLAGLASIATVQLPDLLIGQGGKPVALRTEAGYVLAKGTPHAMMPQLWAHGVGMAEFPRADKENPAWQCDDWGCVATLRGVRIAFSDHPMSLAEDCQQARLLVTPTWRVRCPKGGAWVLDGGDLRFEGIHALWVEQGGWLRMESSRDWQPARAWRSVE